MPISYGLHEKQFKISLVTLNADGSIAITGKFGYIENGDFQGYIDKTFTLNKEDADPILDGLPNNELTRRQDFSLSIYQYLINNNFIEQGQII